MNIGEVITQAMAPVGKNCEPCNPLMTKIEIKSEISKIDRRKEDITNQVMDLISSEMKFIDNGLSYEGSPHKVCLSDKDKEDLKKHLLDAAKEIPGKINAMLKDFDLNDKEEHNDDENRMEIEVQELEQPKHFSFPAAAPAPRTVQPLSNFGY